MKRILQLSLLVMAMLAAGSGNIQAQYQLANSDFEEWESVTYSGRTGNEPKKWSSFMDGTGNLKSMAGYVQLEKSTDKPAASPGAYSAKLTSRAVKLGSMTIAVAQGNLTNGCVNMGSTTPTDAKGNYNYINMGREDQSMKLSGRPDAVKVWIKFKGVKTGNVEVMLVGDMAGKRFQSPENSSNPNTAELIARAQNASIPSKDTWTEYTIPFVYKETESAPEYCLVNISTCATPGAGKEADYMYVDDMVMVYNSEIESATFNEENVVFDENNTATVLAAYDEAALNITSNGRAATIEKSYIAETRELTITVKGENIGEDADNYHVYTIKFASQAVMTITDAKYATFCAPFAVELPTNVNVKAYKCSEIDQQNNLVLEEVAGSIAANTPVILWGERYSVTVNGIAEQTDDNPTCGLLTGIYAESFAPVGSYVLQMLDNKVAFYKVAKDNVKVGANRAYLTVPSSDAKSLNFSAEITAINTVNALVSGKAEVYGANGARQNSLQKGMNITKMPDGSVQKILVK